ncbi:hypothetical protein [Spiroplasma alleghenense]|uniref:Transmembrane protein n=1 Tax=Spiroplasma alleghenense TaxID=216931 RepID=A0A345Z402_9MOLU|nr:hypothetical protein [Spiroplasma alleghenense]AXK51331.1 hypothetical protein SALLE_v1c06610 [Spiroplasma alleghenense]
MVRNDFLKKRESMIFKNTYSDKVFTMIGLLMLMISLTCFVVLITSFAKWFANYEIENLRHRNFVFIKLTLPMVFLSGFWASSWLIIAFSSTEMLKKNRDALILVAIFSINFFIIPQLMKITSLENESETIASVIITDENYRNKSNLLWHIFLMISGCLSIILTPFLMPLIIYVMNNSKKVYLSDFEARKKVSIGILSVFCLNPIFSILQLRSIFKNPMYDVWKMQYNKNSGINVKTGFNKAVSLILWSFFWFTIFALATNIILFYLRFTLVIGEELKYGYLWVFLWINLSTLFSVIRKKYYLENLIPVPLGNCIFDAITFNIPYFFASSIYIFKINFVKESPLETFKYRINRISVFLIMLNIFLLFTFFELIFIFWAIGWIDYSDFTLIGPVWSFIILAIFILSFCWIFLNIRKISNYLDYAIYLRKNYIIDLIFLNFFGLIINIYASILISKMKKKGTWI